MTQDGGAAKPEKNRTGEFPESDTTKIRGFDSESSDAGDDQTDQSPTIEARKRRFSKSNTSTDIIGQIIGRYRIDELIGQGGFGQVFRAYDLQLERIVAIKVPRFPDDASEEIKLRCLEEAKTLAKLDHPRVVGIHDVLIGEDGIPSIVSAFIDGTSLAARIESRDLSLRECIRILVEVGHALAYVHANGVVHLDIKPGNILLDQTGSSYLADFGLALHSEQAVTAQSNVGTPSYMSPERIMGETHRIDGRSDLFSLGVILYEVLVGKRPFDNRRKKASRRRLFHGEPQSPCEIDPSIPRDLERICMKALAKQPSRRYQSATDWVEDLEFFLSSCQWNHDSTSGGSKNTPQKLESSLASSTPQEASSRDFAIDGEELSIDASAMTGSATTGLGTTGSKTTGSKTTGSGITGSGITSKSNAMLPRGLQSYDRRDREFFSDLLPGPYDRDWVPESLAFWRDRILGSEDADAVRVGIVYGPSGCGKSSLIKAGLLPLIADQREAIFIEATHEETASNLLTALKRRYAGLGENDDLVESLSLIRRMDDHERRTPLLIVIDQFEQWLHMNLDRENDQLVTALRQCDGEHIQCLLIVRDDFWLALSRLMSQLDIPITQNVNASLVDLFSVGHAKKVLRCLGAAYGCLPSENETLSDEQSSFVDRAVEELSDRGKVYPVRLALFVEMVKSESWDTNTLDRLGGVDGIGLRFLESSFSDPHAAAAQRTHEPAVRRVLKELLPPVGVDIKGSCVSASKLFHVSGYAPNRVAFDQMMRILESDLRLISASESVDYHEDSDQNAANSDEINCHYQLTHDFLVPTVRDWISNRQRESRRGRAEARLAEYTEVWSRKRDRAFLPTWLDWLSIRLHSSPRHWNSNERRLMRSATKHHVRMSVAVACVALCLVLGARWTVTQFRARSLVAQLRTASVEQLDTLLDHIDDQGVSSQRYLTRSLNLPDRDPSEDWRYELAMGSRHPELIQDLVRKLPAVDPGALSLIAKRLRPLDQESIEYLVNVVKDPQAQPGNRLNATIGLSINGAIAPDTKAAIENNGDVLVRTSIERLLQSPQHNQQLIEGVRPIAKSLREPLLRVALNPEANESRSLAVSFLTQCLSDRPDLLLDFCLTASLEQHERILPTLQPHLHSLTEKLVEIVSKPVGVSSEDETFQAKAKRRAIAAALLHRQGKAEMTWDLLRSDPVPNTRFYLADAVPLLGGDFEAVLDRLVVEPDAHAKRSMIWMLGGFDWNAIAPTLQSRCKSTLRDRFSNDPDSGVHSSAEWFLLQHGDANWLNESKRRMAKQKRDPEKNWYIDPFGTTMAVIDARDHPEINRIFAIATHETTVEQYMTFDPDHEYLSDRSNRPDCPINSMNWFRCVSYCRWLSHHLDADPDHAYPDELSLDNPNVSYDRVVDHGAYRLPTWHEWVFACSAGAESRWFFGSDPAVASSYIDFSRTVPITESRYQPAGNRRPNDAGLFGLYDGVSEWTQTAVEDRKAILSYSSGVEIENISTERVDPTGKRLTDFPKVINGYYGFRVARTLH